MMLTFFLLPLGAAEEESLSAKDNEKRVEVTDTLFVRHLFNSTMFKHNSTDSLIRARHKRTFFHQVGNVFTRFSGNSIPPILPISKTSITTIQ